VKINCVGINDVVNFDGGKNVSHYQQEDIAALGHLVLALACRSPAALQNMSKSLEFVGSRYSAELKNFIVLLLSKSYSSIDDIIPTITSKFVTEMDNLHS
jgi:PAB-dependent poly(A)-specific ribonuclease subunit 3